MSPTPEAIARDKIDQRLEAAGWAVQNLSELNLFSRKGVALREVQSKGGPADYMLNSLPARNYFQRNAMGVAGNMRKINGATLKTLRVPVPPLAEQNQIVAEVEARTTAIDHIEAELDRQITCSNRLHQFSPTEAFSIGAHAISSLIANASY